MSFYSNLVKYKCTLLMLALFLGPTGIIMFIIIKETIRQHTMLNYTNLEFGATLKQCGCKLVDINITGHSTVIKETREQVLEYTQSNILTKPTNESKEFSVKFLNDISANNSGEIKLFPTNRKFKVKDLKSVEKSKLNIFLVESTCGTKKLVEDHMGGFLLTPRQCCTVESAALAHPHHTVYILHTCPLPPQQVSPTHARLVLSLPNVFILNPPLGELFQDSPLHQFFRNNHTESSKFPVFHASDIIRLLLLWRFGGTYLDLDVIVLRSLDKLGSNFIGFESPGWVANGIMNFEPTGHAHKFLETALLYLSEHYDAESYSTNGPVMLTKLVKRECYIYHVAQDCEPISLYVPQVLYPVPWINRYDLVNSTLGPQIVNRVKRTAFTVHCWNGSNKNKIVTVGSSQAYALLADQFCPSVYQNCGKFFI